MSNHNNNNRNCTQDANDLSRRNIWIIYRTRDDDDNVQFFGTRSSYNVANDPIGSTVAVTHPGKYASPF